MATTKAPPNCTIATKDGKTVLTFYRDIPPGMDANGIYDEWLQWVWIGGAGVGPKPQGKACLALHLKSKPMHSIDHVSPLHVCICKVVERGDAVTGVGCLRNIPPINIKEKILEATRPTRVYYNVQNPGTWTYQV